MKLSTKAVARLLVGLQILSIAAAPLIAGLLVPRSRWWLAGVAVAAALAFVFAEIRKRNAEAESRDYEANEARARTDSRVAMVAALQPVAASLADIVISSKADRQAMLGTLTQAIVVAAVRQVAAEDVRGGWYSHDLDASGRRVLRRTNSDGRNDTTSHTEFLQGTIEGDAALAMVDQDDHLYVLDLAANPPEGWDPERVRRYQTFISVGISAKGEPLGMLTVDALDAGSLTDEDLQTMILLASMLRVGLASDF